MEDASGPATDPVEATAMIELTSQNFSQAIDNQPMAIVDFWAPWCAPCRAFAPVFEAAAAKHRDAVFAKVNTEDQQELAGQFGIRSIPTLMIFRDNIIVFSEAGALSAGSLQQVLDAAKALNMDAVRRSIAEQEAGESAGAEPHGVGA